MSYSTEVLADSPLVYWKLDETAAVPTTADAGSNATAWTWGGGAIAGKPPLLPDGGASASGTGADAIATLNSVPASVTGDNVTLEAWLKIPAANTNGSVLKVGNASGGWSFGVGGTTQDNAGKQLILLSEGKAWHPTGYTLTTGTHHVMVVRGAAGAYTCYVDGASVASGTLTAPIAASGMMGLGGYGVPGRNLSFTDVDNAAVYASALSSARATAHYNGGAGDNTAVAADSPVVWLKLDEPVAGNAIADSSGNARQATHFGGVTINQPSLLGDGTGKSASYDGADDYTRITGGTWVNTSTPTVEVRYTPTAASLTGTKPLASAWASGNRWFVWLNGGKVEATIFTGSNRVVTGSTTLVAGTTYTIAFKYDGANLKVLVNGVVDGSAPVTGAISTASTVAVELGRVAEAIYGPGTLDEFSYYNTALSDARLLARHNAAVAAESTVDVSLAGALPTVTGAFTLEAAAAPVDVSLAGTLPTVTGAFTLDAAAAPFGDVDLSLAGTLPTVTGAFTLKILAVETATTDTNNRANGRTRSGKGYANLDEPVTPKPATIHAEPIRIMSQTLSTPTLEKGRPV